MMRKISLLLLSLSAALYAAEGVDAAYPERLRELLKAADSTEVYRLTGDDAKDADPASWKKGPVWDAARTREISGALLKNENYVFSMRKLCEPRWGVIFRLKSGDKNIDVRMCYECSILYASSEKVNAKDLHFDPSRALWSKWAKEAFPNDPAIQKLKGINLPPEEKARIDAEMEKLERELKEKAKKKEEPK